MNLLRTFARGLARSIIRRMVTRRVGGAATRSASRLRTRTQSSRSETDSLLDDIADQIDVIEALELASEAPAIVDNARFVAAEGSAGAFYEVMEQMNPGQKALAEQYGAPYAEEYWQTTNSPDLDDFLSGMYSQHEAMEQALGNTSIMSYEAGRLAGAASLITDLQSYISLELLSRGFTMANIKNAKSDWGKFADWAHSTKGNQTFELLDAGVPGKALRYRDGEVMVIGDKAGEFYGATRQLSYRQFMGNDQPYWFTESRRMFYAQIQGKMSYDDFSRKRSELYSATYKDPWSTSPPPGYSPYSGPEFSYNG